MNESNLYDDYVTFNKKLTKLHERTLKLKREELATKYNNDDYDGGEMSDEKCMVFKSDVNDCDYSHFHIQDLCPMDRKQISRIIDKLTVCTQVKNNIESELAVIKSENEAIINRYELFTSKYKEENNKLRSKLAEMTAQQNKLCLQTAYSLDIFTDDIKAQQNKYLKIIDAINDLLRENVRLNNEIILRDSRLRVADEKIERIKNETIMKELLFIDEHMNNIIDVKKIDQSCQTDELLTSQ